ncbi:MAG TPA: ADP-ribosylglycohydrolase family protein [Puia sp.]|nr:ADP-ribosylglycohydrolase family protein [Puia sp.]
MRKFLIVALIAMMALPFTPVMAQNNKVQLGKTVTIPEAALRDKIKGGWAGQTIGVTFGGPYEFRYNGTFIQDYQPLFYSEGYIRKVMLGNPGLYDDLYMDLTFVDVFERLGLDAPVDSFASAFAHAGYMLWHANQAARYNILNGIKPPASGNWINSPHADDIDYQIECDYAGLMSPGMPNTASAISDKIGHIMNYGDGWYGGVYFGAMYSLAFLSDDVNWIVTEALNTIPQTSTYRQCMEDVIRWHEEYPTDWHSTWFELQKKWSSDRACPEGVFNPFDIDATINSAYVVMALLYGNGDFGRTLDIAARAGQDADCNPSSAGGILGTILGYDKLPEYWKKGLSGAEDIDFKYTSISLNKVYAIGYKHALENIRRNGGQTANGDVSIKTQEPKPVKLEQSFQGLYPVRKDDVGMNADHTVAFDFEGTGFILSGDAYAKNDKSPRYIFQTEVWLDGKKIESPALPTDFTTRRLDLTWKYPLPGGKHTVQFKVLNPDDKYGIRGLSYIVFADAPAKATFAQKADTVPYHMTTYVYKRVDTAKLQLDVYTPVTAETKSCAAIVLFHGGGWTTGKRSQLSWQSRYFAQRGLVAITADYRLLGKDTSLIDAKSAARWVKAHAKQLGIDTSRMIYGGGSAGGHLAVMTLLNKDHNDPGDDLSITPTAQALVLFNPAYELNDNPSIEPFEFADAHFPPSIYFFGSMDKHWLGLSDSLCRQVGKAGVYSESWIAEGQTHGFFRKAPWDLATCVKAQAFLAKLGLMSPAKPAPELQYNTLSRK